MANVDRDLLFGLIALQNGLVDQAALVAAFRAWTREKGRPLADHLADLGLLDEDGRVGVEAMVALHLGKFPEPETSLASLPVGGSTRDLLVALGDPELTVTLERLASGVGSDSTEPAPDRTATYSVGEATADGQRFRVLRPHARGGLGAVFVALDAELHREVALKQILDRFADDPDSRQRFVAEAEITGGLEHPGIVPVYGLGAHKDGRPFYAMRFIRGDSLKQAIADFHADEALKADPGRRSLGLRNLLRRFLDVCNAIEYAHSRGVLHRDIKPGNVIVGKHGETLVVDWGLAKARGWSDGTGPAGEGSLSPPSSSGSAETMPGQAMGTPAYVSPEQARGDLEALGPASDVYSLGATLYCLLAGRPPFEGDVADVLLAVQEGKIRPPRQFDPSIDRALEAVCLKAMARDPRDRYPGARALAGDVERWMADEPVEAYRDPLTVRAARWSRRRRTLVSSLAVLLITAVVALSISTGLIWAEQRRTADARRAADAQRDRAEAEKARAGRNFDLAWGMASDLAQLVEMNETGLAPSPASLPARRVVLDRALVTSDRLLADRPDDPDMQGRGARLLRYAANLGRFVNDVDAADLAYQGSIRLQEGLVARTPGDPGDRDRLAQTLRDYASFQHRVGRLAAASATIERAVAMAEQLRDADPSQFQWPLAVALLDRSEVDSLLARPDRSEQSADRAGKLLDEQLGPGRAPPHHLAPLFRAMTSLRLAIARREMALAGLGGASIEAALAAHDDALGRFQKLLESDQSADVVHNFARARAERARTSTGIPARRAQAAEDLDDAIRRWEDLARRLPQAPPYREWMATGLVLRANLRAAAAREQGPEAADASRKAAGQDLKAAIERLETLAQGHPTSPVYRSLLGEAWVASARVAQSPADLERCVERSLSSFRAARNRDPENPHHPRMIAEVEREWPQVAATIQEKRRAREVKP